METKSGGRESNVCPGCVVAQLEKGQKERSFWTRINYPGHRNHSCKPCNEVYFEYALDWTDQNDGAAPPTRNEYWRTVAQRAKLLLEHERDRKRVLMERAKEDVIAGLNGEWVDDRELFKRMIDRRYGTLFGESEGEDAEGQRRRDKELTAAIFNLEAFISELEEALSKDEAAVEEEAVA